MGVDIEDWDEGILYDCVDSAYDGVVDRHCVGVPPLQNSIPMRVW